MSFEIKDNKLISYYSEDGVTEVAVPDGVTSINGCAFSGCPELTSITIPASVRYIGGEAFKGCDNLKLYVPPTVEDLARDALMGCTIVLKAKGVSVETQYVNLEIPKNSMYYYYRHDFIGYWSDEQIEIRRRYEHHYLNKFVIAKNKHLRFGLFKKEVVMETKTAMAILLAAAYDHDPAMQYIRKNLAEIVKYLKENNFTAELSMLQDMGYHIDSLAT